MEVFVVFDLFTITVSTHSTNALVVLMDGGLNWSNDLKKLDPLSVVVVTTL